MNRHALTEPQSLPGSIEILPKQTPAATELGELQPRGVRPIDKDVAAPPMFYGLVYIPQSISIAFQGLDEFHVMAPGQLCNKLLHDLLVEKRLTKGAHVFEVSWRKPRHFREIAPKVRSEPIDDAADRRRFGARAAHLA